MIKLNYNLLAYKMLTRRTKPYPVNKYNFRSSKYKYVYNISIDGIVFWHAHLNLFGITWDDDFYSNTEEEAAFWIYKQIKKHLEKIKKDNKRWDNKKRRKHINWQIWLIIYQHHQYPKRICELKII